MDDEINNQENHTDNEKEGNRNPLEYFKVTPDDYTDSDSNTIIDFDEEEEDSKIQNHEEEQEHEQEKEKVNQGFEKHEHEDYTSQEQAQNEEDNENEMKKATEQHNEKEEEHENENGDEQEEGMHNEDEDENQKNNEEEEKGEDQENQDENEEENEITDANVKQLMKIDLGNKEGIIDLLMKDNLIKRSTVKSEKFIKERNSSKFEHIESKIGKNPIGNKKTSYGRQGFQIVSEEGNPEFIKDMDIAADAVKDKIQEENQDVAKILFDDGGAQKITKRLTRDQIDEKVKKTLEKKKKRIEKIEARIYEQKKAEETFAPVINHRKGENSERRTLNKFLKDQNNFTKKVIKKREDLKTEKETKNNTECVGKPKVDKNSEELAKKLKNKEEPAYLRLYNKRTLKQEKIAEKEKQRKEKKKEEEMKLKEKLNETKKLYENIQSRIKIVQKKEDVDQFGSADNKKNKEIQEKEKQKIIEKKMKKKKGKILDVKDIPTNKMIFNNFEKRFGDAIKSIEKENLTEEELHNLLYNIGMVTHSFDEKDNNEDQKNKNEENNEEQNDKKNNAENSTENTNTLKTDENKLISEIVKCLKNESNEINKEDIKNFLICVLGIQKYAFYHKYKTEHESQLKELYPPNKFKKEDIPEIFIKKHNEELLSNVEKNNEKNTKYSYHANTGKIYISLEKGHAIKKDFNLLALNYRNYKDPSKENKALKHKKEFNFKPQINENNEKFYKKYVEKTNPAANEGSDKKNQGKDAHMEYIDRNMLFNKKKIEDNKKAKEEQEKDQLKECTFKPKINTKYSTKKKKTEKKDKNEKKNRMVEMYQKGTADILKRKNRTKEEMEAESQIKECTFQPNLKEEKKIPETKFTNDIYKEKEYKHLYERLRQGRMERLVKESANDRYDLNNELKNFVKESKEIKNKEFLEEEKSQDDFTDSNNRRSKRNKQGAGSSNKKNSSSRKNEEDNYNNSAEQSSEDDGEKKEGIPMLIIDVNIRQGVKKKIYVYEGDTPEGLAEKFAKEHNLEEETKTKLQNLIHTHIVRLLTRIEEENQSISEKSQATHNNKK